MNAVGVLVWWVLVCLCFPAVSQAAMVFLFGLVCSLIHEKTHTHTEIWKLFATSSVECVEAHKLSVNVVCCYYYSHLLAVYAAFNCLEGFKPELKFTHKASHRHAVTYYTHMHSCLTKTRQNLKRTCMHNSCSHLEQFLLCNLSDYHCLPLSLAWLCLSFTLQSEENLVILRPMFNYLGSCICAHWTP